MAKNKVVFGGNTIIDLTPTTATASDVASGKIFFGKDGVQTTGTASGSGGAIDTVTTLPSGGDYHAIVGTPISGTLNISSNGTYDVSSYASADVSVSGGGGGSPTTGTFIVTSTYTGSNIGVICLRPIPLLSGGNMNVAYPFRIYNGMNNNTGRITLTWYVNDDGYMYVTFIGSTDSYTPSVTGTSGTVQLIYTGTKNSSDGGGNYASQTPVVYKISQGAEMTVSYYNNN